MGRPVKKSRLAQFTIATSAGAEAIIEQTGTSKYKTAIAGDVFLVNKATGFDPGEAAMACMPFGGTLAGDTELVEKVTQYRVTTFDGNTYVWVPTGTVTKAGEAELNPAIVAPLGAITTPEPEPKIDYTPEPEQKPEPIVEPEPTPVQDDLDLDDDVMPDPKYQAEKEPESKKEATVADLTRKPKLSSRRKAKAKEQSKPIEDLLAGLDNDEIEV